MVYTLRVNLRRQGYPLKSYTYSKFKENNIQQFVLRGYVKACFGNFA
jgi:hypothetical protein